MSKIADLWILAAKKKTQVRTHASRILGYAGTPYLSKGDIIGDRVLWPKSALESERAPLSKEVF
jgi:hypothetical protein